MISTLCCTDRPTATIPIAKLWRLISLGGSKTNEICTAGCRYDPRASRFLPLRDYAKLLIFYAESQSVISDGI